MTEKNKDGKKYGKQRKRQRSLVCGVGVNDVEEPTRINGKQCKIYKTWKDMLRRCYDEKSIKKCPTYAGCTVCEDWLLFSNFKAWMTQQDYQGKQLDKDILIEGNKVYSPDNCCFVSKQTNTFMLDSGKARGKYLIGSCFHKGGNKFASYCKYPSGKLIHLGLYRTELEAHLAWKKKKHELACQLADQQTDLAVANALRKRFM